MRTCGKNVVFLGSRVTTEDFTGQLNTHLTPGNGQPISTNSVFKKPSGLTLDQALLNVLVNTCTYRSSFVNCVVFWCCLGVSDYERLRPVNWLLDDITVVKDGDNYNVTMETLNCDSNLPLFNIGHAQVTDYTYTSTYTCVCLHTYIYM